VAVLVAKSNTTIWTHFLQKIVDHAKESGETALVASVPVSTSLAIAISIFHAAEVVAASTIAVAFQDANVQTLVKEEAVTHEPSVVPFNTEVQFIKYASHVFTFTQESFISTISVPSTLNLYNHLLAVALATSVVNNT